MPEERVLTSECSPGCQILRASPLPAQGRFPMSLVLCRGWRIKVFKALLLVKTSIYFQKNISKVWNMGFYLHRLFLSIPLRCHVPRSKVIKAVDGSCQYKWDTKQLPDETLGLFWLSVFNLREQASHIFWSRWLMSSFQFYAYFLDSREEAG